VALTLTIDGIDRTDLLKDGSIDIEKVGPTESLRLDVLVRDGSALAYRPGVGDPVRLLHNAGLLFGGPIWRIEDARLGQDDVTVTRITVRDWMSLAEQIILDHRVFPGQGAFTLFDELVTTYLADKGVTNISVSLTGGPLLADLSVVNETLLSVFHQITEQTGYPFQINGDKQCALVEPGASSGPVTLTPGTNLLDGSVSWMQDELFTASRLRLTTGVPVSGAGPVTHSETRTANGVQIAFPVNVLPNHSQVALVDLEAGYAAGATAMAVRDLTPGMVLAVASTFTLGTSLTGTSYALTGAVTVDDDGTATIAFTPALGAAVVHATPVIFSAETGLVLTVGGVATPLRGAPWAWDAVHQAVVTSGAPPALGVPVVVAHRVTFPAIVRVWETAPLPPQTDAGYFDWQLLRDGVLEDATNQTDLAQAAGYARELLSRMVVAPKVVRGTTYTPGWYPFLSATIVWPERLLDGPFLVETVRIRQVDIDPATTTHELPYELEMVEGDRLRQSWIDYYRGENPARGIRWGEVHNDAYVSQSVIEVLIAAGPEGYDSQSVIEVLVRDTSASATVSQVAIEVLIQ